MYQTHFPKEKKKPKNSKDNSGLLQNTIDAGE